MSEEEKAVKLTDEETNTVTGGAETGTSEEIAKWITAAKRELHFYAIGPKICHICGKKAFFTAPTPEQLMEGALHAKCYNCGKSSYWTNG